MMSFLCRCALLIALLFPGKLLAEAPASFFFTPKEEAQILVLRAKKQTPLSDLGPSVIRLDALLYLGNNQWKIWLNSQAFEQGHTLFTKPGLPPLTIDEVNAQTVLLTLHPPSKAPLTIRLRPYQAYDYAADSYVQDNFKKEP